MLQFVATELERIGAKYLAAKKGYKSTAGIFTHVLQPLLGTATHPGSPWQRPSLSFSWENPGFVTGSSIL